MLKREHTAKYPNGGKKKRAAFSGSHSGKEKLPVEEEEEERETDIFFDRSAREEGALSVSRWSERLRRFTECAFIQNPADCFGKTHSIP